WKPSLPSQRVLKSLLLWFEIESNSPAIELFPLGCCIPTVFTTPSTTISRLSKKFMSNHWIGVDLGGTKILAGLFDNGFRVLARAKEATDAELGADAVIARIHAAVAALLAETGVDRRTIRGMGVGIPGQVDPRVGKVRFAPNLSWRDLELSRILSPEWS